MRFKKLVLLSALSFSLHAAWAGVPYLNQAIEVKQPNGEKLQLVVTGNLYYAEQRTKDGALVVFDESKKAYCYAEVNAAGDNLISTGIIASDQGPRLFSAKAGEPQAGLSNAAKAALAKANHQRLMGGHKHAKASLSAESVSAGPVIGAVKGLTVMIQFPDQAGTITKTQVENFLNNLTYTEFGNAQSVRGYFQSASGGKLDYTNYVPRYYTAKRNKAYYTDSSRPYGERAQELIGEALAWLQTSEGFDFSTLSTDGSKKIRGLNFFYAGETDGGWSQGLWPHMGTLDKAFCANGVCTNGYQISNMSSKLAIGTFVHESGHLLFDWPDLYDYDGSSNGSLGAYCMMGTGSVGAATKLKPVLPNGFFRHLVGWDNVVELNPLVNVNAPKGTLNVVANGHTLYRWSNQGNPKEAFYLEGMMKTGQNSNQIAQGLAVWHVDPAGDNSNEWHPYVQMEHADGRRDQEKKVNSGDAGDLYNGSTTKTFSDTVPNALTSRGTNAKWWNNSNSGFVVSNIGVPAANIAVTVGAVTPPKTDTYTGTLQSGRQVILPSGGFQYAGGTLTVKLTGPTTGGVDFDMTLEKLVNGVWTKVAESAGPTSQESIGYAAQAGSYRVVVLSYAGAGAYKLTISK